MEPYIKLFFEFNSMKSSHGTCRDGLHFTASGNRVLFEEVVSCLRKEGLSLESLLVDQPLFCDIDPADPLKSFTGMTTKWWLCFVWEREWYMFGWRKNNISYVLIAHNPVL